jgi:hypothetical protein
MLIYQLYKLLKDGTPEVLCAGTTKWKAEVILRESYPQEYGKIIWLDKVRREGKLRIVDGQVIK